MSKMIEKKIKDFIEKYELIQLNETIVVGVSGGADSITLLHYLYKHQEVYQIQLKAAHVHHGIREEAEKDAKYVEGICKEWHIPFYRHDCNIKQLSKERKVSQEEAGRQERYNFFISLLNGDGKIATAHNMNDQAETLIMRFIRGTDIKGLGGIAPKRKNIIRPLLCLTRGEIEDYCRYYHLEYRQDATNFVPIYTRNKIRLECLPYIEKELNRSVIRVLAEHSHLYREEEAFLEEATQTAYKTVTLEETNCIKINNELFSKQHPYIKKRLIYYSIRQLVGSSKDISMKHIEESLKLIEGQNGKKISLPYGIILEKAYHITIMKCQQIEHAELNSALTIGKQFIEALNMTLELSIVSHDEIYQKDEKLYTKYIDYGKIKNGLQIRFRQSGDYMNLGNMTKKLNRIFIDDKIPKSNRDKWPIIADGSEVVWIIGGRLNTKYYVTEAANKILQIKMIEV